MQGEHLSVVTGWRDIETLMTKHNALDLLTAIAALAYWGAPVIQYHMTHSLEHHWTLALSYAVYGFFLLVVQAPVPFLIQLSCALLTWVLLRMSFRDRWHKESPPRP
jgi:hypothetical protein